MIAALHGRLEGLGGEQAIINVGGVCFEVHMPVSALGSLSDIGGEVHIYTHLHLREDGATLYGFAADQDLALFRTLLTVSGIGPRLALAMLSAMNAERLTMAIASGDVDMLTEIPGIGKKTASRLVLELKDKVAQRLGAWPLMQVARDNSDVLGALTSLGYSLSEATKALGVLPASGNLDLEEKVKLVLQHLGAGRS